MLWWLRHWLLLVQIEFLTWRAAWIMAMKSRRMR